jgi:Zn-finger nucleic acid-binding protein
LKLIACQVCHTQYDVSQVDAPELTCRCGETLANEPPAAVDAVVARCGSCGAQVGATAEGCEYCGSDIVRELEKLSLICPECFARNADDGRFCIACGVAFAPEALPVDGHELPCPACETRMPPSAVGGIAVNECPGCHGLWVVGKNFDALVRRAARAWEERSATAEPPRVSGANPARQALQYRRCPECDQFMLRVNYKRSSGIILDECRTHGSWLDSDELEQVAGFILAGGHTKRTAVDLEREKVSAEAAAAVARVRMGAQSHARTPRSAGVDLGLGLLRTIFDILT